MQILYLNTTTGEWFDQFGAPFADASPQVSFQGRETLQIHAVTDTPNAGELGVNPANWQHDTQWAALGASALITVDNDYIHKLRGTLNAELASGEVSLVSVKLAAGITEAQIPAQGVLTIGAEMIAYSARVIGADNTVEFTAAGTLANSYATGEAIDVPQAPYCSARMSENSAPGNGVYEFDLVVDSLRLREAMLYSSVASLTIQGLELLFYRTTSNGNIPIRAFLCETFAVTGTLGDVDYSVPLPEEEAADRAYEIIASIVSAGVELQISADGESWNDYTEGADFSDIRFIRWRNSQVGGAWSPAVPLIAGADGKSAYDVAVDNGFEGTAAEWLESLVGQGEPGDSAYEVAQENGYIGTVDEWLESLKGEKGDGLDYDVSGTALIDRSNYDDRPAGFKFAYAAANQSEYTTTLYIYTKLSDDYADWSEALAIVFYGSAAPEVVSIRPVEFTPPPDTQNVYFFTFPAPQDATVAQVCIDTDEGELILPYYSDKGVRKILKVGGNFFVYFGNAVQAYTSGRVYLTQMVAADSSQGGGSGDITVVGGTMYYGYLPSSDTFQSVTAITADMLEAETLTAVDASAVGAVALGEVPAGSFTVVLVPAASGLTVKKDDGFGGKVAFEVDNGLTGSGANGATVTLGGNEFNVYGEFNIVSGITDVYINEE